MKLSHTSSYALRALAFLASQEGNRVVPSHEIARTVGLPERFLLKVLKALPTARILYSIRGPNGGYRLARPANQITLLDVIEAVDGPIRGRGPGDAWEERGLDRRLQEICDKAAEQLRVQLKKVKLSELATKMAGSTAK